MVHTLHASHATGAGMSSADRARPGPLVTPRHRDDALKSVANALDVLDCFMSDDELGVSELARSLGVAKSSAHRMLSTLAGRGFVEQNPDTGRYRLGLHLYELGQLSVSRSRLRQAALPIMEDLRQRTGHTIHLGIADGCDVVHLERLQSREGLDIFDTLPERRFPTHCSATGKVLAAFDPAAPRSRRSHPTRSAASRSGMPRWPRFDGPGWPSTATRSPVAPCRWPPRSTTAPAGPGRRSRSSVAPR